MVLGYELNIINWHIKFLQDGRNAKQILEDYEAAILRNRRLTCQIEVLKEEHSDTLKTEKKKLREC